MSATAYDPQTVPSGQSAPFLVVSATDHGADIVLVSATAIALLLVCLAIRVYIRSSFSGPWLVDDTVFALATAVALAQASVVCASVHFGWGKVVGDIRSLDLVRAEKLVYVADLLYIVTLALSKHSIDHLFIRLSPYKRHIFTAKCIRCIVAVWAIASIGAISLRCHLSDPWIDTTAGQCLTMLVRWQVITAFNIVTEVAIFGLSIFLVVGLRMQLSQKLVVVIAFGLRLPTITFCVLRIHYFVRAFYSSDPTFDGVYFAVWTQVELVYSVIAATLPCLKPFMSSISTNWGEQPKHAYNTSAISGGYGLRSLFGKSDKSGPSSNTGWQISMAGEEMASQEDSDLPCEPAYGNTTNHKTLRGDSVSHFASVNHGMVLGDDGVSTRSNDSQQMIIRKSTMYSVERT